MIKITSAEKKSAVTESYSLFANIVSMDIISIMEALNTEEVKAATDENRIIAKAEITTAVFLFSLKG